LTPYTWRLTGGGFLIEGDTVIWILLAVVITPVIVAAVCACVVAGWRDEGVDGA
jgi:hypothetical protein